MTTSPDYDTDGDTFDGRYPRPVSARRRPTAPRGHALGCSSNPEIGCVCSEAERERPRPRSTRPVRREQPTPFSLAADADPSVQARRRAAFEAQERAWAR